MQKKGFIYVYRIKTPSEVIIKVGHGITHPQTRMNDYCATYGLNVEKESLKYWSVLDSADTERKLFKILKHKGYRNLKEGNLGPQELFQAPHGVKYSKVLDQIETGIKELNSAKNYSIEDLIGVVQPPKKPLPDTPISVNKNILTSQIKKKIPPQKKQYVKKSTILFLILIVALMAFIISNAAEIKGILIEVFEVIISILKVILIFWLYSLFEGKKRRKRRFW